MTLPNQAERLRIYTKESDTSGGRPLHEIIVNEARALGLAGATVMRGMAGFGADSRLHTSKILRLSENLPMVTEIVDTPERIEAFLPTVEKTITKGLVTREPIQVALHRNG